MTTHLSRGESLDDFLTSDVLRALRPDGALGVELEEQYDSGEYELEEDSEPVDAENTVAGVPWGWFRTSESTDGSPWRLIPLSFQADSHVLVTLSAWQSGSMTGAQLGSGVRRHGDIAIVWVDLDEEGRLIDVTYGESDAEELVLGAVHDVLEGGGPLCPAGGHSEGWVISLDVADSVQDAIVSKALVLIWRPCSDHCDITLEVGQSTWAWSNGSWEQSLAESAGGRG